MTITLPKPLRTYQYRPLTVFSLLDADTDRVLPALFEMCVKGGRASRSQARPDDFASYRDRLLAGGALDGFTADDRPLLDGWLRSCVVDMGTVGRGRRGEQMLAVAPLTLAAYRAGLPKERTRHRGIDDAVHRLLLDALARRGAPRPAAALRDLVVGTVGRGLDVGPQPYWEPLLADPARLDIGALLELRFVEGFATGAAREVDTTAYESPLPAVAADLGDLLLTHLRVYGDRLPVPALTSSFAALLALGVFTLSLRTDAAAHALLRTGAPPPDMRPGPAPASGLELYCDLTDDVGSASHRLTRRCVDRDLDRVRLAFRDRMTFVAVEQAMTRLPAEQARKEGLTAPERLHQLAALRTHEDVEFWARKSVDSLLFESEDALTDPEKDLLHRLQRREGAELDKLLDVLAEVNETTAVRNAVQWYWSVGGLEKPYGLLRGSSRQRRSWRYTLGDELLTALLLAVFVADDGTPRPTMPLRAVLDALERRFGLLVDRPPAFLDGAEARAAAAANLEAFTTRLQLLGCFDSLSDDFSVQVVRHPLGDHLPGGTP